MKTRWILVAALFLLFAGLFAWEKGWLPFNQWQADIPLAGEQFAADQAAPDNAGESPDNASKTLGTEAASQGKVEGDGKTGADLVQPGAPDAANPDEESAAPGEEVVKGTVEKGDTVTKILAGSDSQAVQDYISAARRVFSMRAFRDGQPYVVVTDAATGKVKRFEYEIDSRRRLVVEGMEQPVARVEAIEYVTLLTTMSATIDDNLFQAVADAGESPQMALKLAELFGSEINFIRDLQEGDSFSVLVEKRYREGEYKGYGRILAAHFTNKGKTFEAYLFREGNKAASYYNSKGENVRKSLLQAPLAFTRVTSRFTKNRLHPILGYTRPHEGVDYAAPTGTPVKAVGEGVVTQRGWAGGYGNQVIVRHGGGLESLYAHLSGYARGLQTGQKVRQGQVIGFVGMTGLATGPHLDFRLRQNGKFVNPAKAINPRGEPVSKSAMSAFEKVMAVELAALKGERTFPEYTVDSIVVDKVDLPQPEKSSEPEHKAEKRKKKHKN